MSSLNKKINKWKIQERVNPGRKKAYEPLPRPRSVVFASKKDYNRQALKKDLRNEVL